MKKKGFKALLLAGALLVSGIAAGSAAVPVAAQDIPVDWTVTFSQGGKIESNFKSSDINDKISQMQPGDRTVFNVTLKNDNSAAADWYMKNEVLRSLEDSVKNAAGGAYTYVLSFTDSANKTTTLFNSDTVGGDTVVSADLEGLREATAGLDNWSFLYNLGSGASGSVRLEVALDGVTQGNNYQDSVADLMLEFGVEVNSTPVVTAPPTTTTTTTTVGTPVKTGDDFQPLLYILLAAIAGVVLLVLAIFGIKSRKREEAAAETQDKEGGRG